MLPSGRFPCFPRLKRYYSSFGKQEEAKKQLLANIDPSNAKREAKAQVAEAARNSFETVVREWFDRYSASWPSRYRVYIMGRLEKNLFPHIGKRLMGDITAREFFWCTIERIYHHDHGKN